MAMPLDIPWKSGIWADQPGFSAPADGSPIPGAPSDFGGNLISIGGVTWSTSIGNKGKPSFNFPNETSQMSVSPTWADVTTFTAVVVGQVTSSSGGDLLDGPSGFRHLLDSNGLRWRTFTGTTVVSAPPADTDMHFFILELSTLGVDTLYVDTVQFFSAESGSDPNGTMIIGSSVNGGHFGSKVAFVGFIDRTLTIQEKDDLWAWYQSDYVNYVGTTVSSKRDALLASLPGTGSVSDRLHAREESEYLGADTTEPLTLNDYLVANGEDKNIIQ
jgi:hypothetical protein